MIKVLGKKKLKVVIILFLLIVLYMFASSSKLQIVHYPIKTNKLNSQIRIALITDLHSCSYGDKQSQLITALNKQNPDVVLLSGDIFDDVVPHENSRIFLTAVSKRYPCYYVSGNHEYWSGEIDSIKKMIRDTGTVILEGDCKKVHIGGQTINICGVDDPASIGLYEMEAQITKASTSCDTSFFSILMSHRPELVTTYKKYNFDLILSGHAHGGQWRIPGILNGLYSPNQGSFPKYAGGRYSFNNTTMIVSRGLVKKEGWIPRIFNRPELALVDLS